MNKHDITEIADRASIALDDDMAEQLAAIYPAVRRMAERLHTVDNPAPEAQIKLDTGRNA